MAARLERIREVQRVLDGPPTRQVVLDGLSAVTTRIALPEPRTDLSAGLGQIIATRSSRYRFDATPPSAADLSSLLRWSLGPQRTVRLPGGAEHRMCMAPSAGGLPSLSVYVGFRPGGEGIALQNLYLVATALELAGCAVTGFDDHALAQLLRLPDTMFPTVLFPFGRRPR
ncbi:MAG: nitroreductase family protein [Pseudonocardiales bacterium]